MKLDTEAIKAELQELTPAKVKVKLNRKLEVGLSIKETDDTYAIQFNPSRIRNQQRLDSHLDMCRQSITR